MLARSQPDRVELIARWVDLTGQSLRQFSYDSPWSETVDSVANRETGWATINREASLPNFAAQALGVIALDGSVISGPIRRTKTRGRPPSPVRIWRRRPPTILFPTPSLSTMARSSRSGDRRSSRPTTPSFRSGGDRRLTTARPARPMPAIWPSPCPRHPHPINRGGHRPAETTTDPSALIRTPQSPFRNKTVLGFGAVSRILFLPLTRDSVVISLGPLRTRPPSIACATAAGCDIPAAMGRATQPPILPCTGWGFSCRRHC